MPLTPSSFTPSAEQLFECRILVVDDGEANRKLIRENLLVAGYRNVESACDGIEALSMIERAAPDLMLLDAMMPGLDGFEVCRRLMTTNRRFPIIFQTAFSGPRERANAFSVGATDFINKPILRAELLARVRLHLENRLSIQNLKQYQMRVADELQLARSLQIGLLPSAPQLDRLAEEYGLAISGHLETSSELGGDFWGLRALDGGQVAVMLADVSGHGVTAALNSFRLHTLIGTLDDALVDPAHLLEELNRALRPLFPTGHFATFFAAVFDLVRHRLTYAGAGWPSPIYAIDGIPEVIEASGLPLGIIDDARYRNRERDFPPGAQLLLYSDALVECTDRWGFAWDEQRVARELSRFGGEPANLIQGLLGHFFGAERAIIADDLTLVAIRRER